jgi:hypothetical protein
MMLTAERRSLLSQWPRVCCSSDCAKEKNQTDQDSLICTLGQADAMCRITFVHVELGPAGLSTSMLDHE